MCTNGGILLFTVYDQRCAASLMILAILEIIHVVWIYGTENFFDNLSEMGMDMNKPLRYNTGTLFPKLNNLLTVKGQTNF